MMVDLESADMPGKVIVGVIPRLVPSEWGDLPGIWVDAFAAKDGGQGVIYGSCA